MSRLSWFCLVLGLIACDGDPPPDAGTPRDSAAPSCERDLAPIEAGDDGHATPLSAGPGEVRAGRLTETDLPADPTGLAVWSAGDYVLANDRVAILIEDAGVSDLYDPYGGRPVGVAAVEGGALVRAGDFNEILFGFGGYLVQTETVSVVNDGSDGNAAVIRAIGPLRSMEAFGDLLTELLPGEDYSGLPAAMEYEMAPGGDSVGVYLVVGQPEPGAVRVPFLVDAFFQRYRMPSWTEAEGFVTPTSALPLVAFVDDAGTSYAFLAPGDDELSLILDQAGVLIFSAGNTAIPGCEYTRIHMGTIVLGGPGLGGLQSALARRRGDTLRTVTGTLTHADGSPAPEARVHVRHPDGRHFARVSPAADGTFSLEVPSTEMSFFAYRTGTSLVGPISVGADTSSVDLTLGAVGRISVGVTDVDGGGAIPARVQVLPVGGAPEIPGDLGERRIATGRSHIEFTTGERVELDVEPGEHDIVISRGYEYELETRRVTVAADETVTVDVALERVIDTTGVLCADYHIHTHRSPDSPDSPQRKLLSLIADGLEIAVRTDHEWTNDFTPVIEELGLSEFVLGVSGEELTTFGWGHFGVFPLPEDRSRPSGGAIPWVGRLPPEVFAEARARDSSPIVIINHPRSGGVFGGYFNAAALDGTTGVGNNTDLWDERFRVVEVFNDSSFDSNRDGPVADWFALLNGGRRIAAVGSSDSHNADTSPVGYPRTCLRLGTDDPREVTPERLRDETAAGHSTISGGIYLDVTGPGDTYPGDDAVAGGATASVAVRVQAASFIEGALALEVIVDGLTVQMIDITESDRDPTNPAIRLDAMIDVPVAATGSWVVFHVRSDGDLSAIHTRRTPFAVSNPLFLSR